jgi:hypothetical protein
MSNGLNPRGKSIANGLEWKSARPCSESHSSGAGRQARSFTVWASRWTTADEHLRSIPHTSTQFHSRSLRLSSTGVTRTSPCKSADSSALGRCRPIIPSTCVTLIDVAIYDKQAGSDYSIDMRNSPFCKELSVSGNFSPGVCVRAVRPRGSPSCASWPSVFGQPVRRSLRQS